MQMLFDRSFEYGEHKGLGLIPGDVIDMRPQIPAALKVPHIGWNALIFKQANHPLFRYINEGDCVYFVNGRTVTGKWKRPTLEDPTTYVLYDGTVLRLEPGNTWIMMMPNQGDIRVRYAG